MNWQLNVELLAFVIWSVCQIRFIILALLWCLKESSLNHVTKNIVSELNGTGGCRDTHLHNVWICMVVNVFTCVNAMKVTSQYHHTLSFCIVSWSTHQVGFMEINNSCAVPYLFKESFRISMYLVVGNHCWILYRNNMN